MSWADIYRREMSSGDVRYRVYLGGSSRAESDEIVPSVIKKLRPVLDLIPPFEGSGGWVWWSFSEEEYRAMVGDEDETGQQQG